METFALLPLTMASLLASYSDPQAPVEEAVIATHISPEIAGLWELDEQESERLSAELLNSFKEEINKRLNGESNEALDSDMQEFLDAAQAEIGEGSSPDVDVVDRQNAMQVHNMEGMQTLTVTETSNLIIDQQMNQSPFNALKQNKTCKERYNFAADNEVIVTSGEEWSYGSYLYRHLDDGLPMLAMRTIYENNAVDCAGNQIDQTGDTMFAFVNYMPDKNVMHWCVDKEGTQCFMSLRKLLP